MHDKLLLALLSCEVTEGPVVKGILVMRMLEFGMIGGMGRGGEGMIIQLTRLQLF